MRSLIAVLLLINFASCNESYYFKKSLTRQDKKYLSKNDSITKSFAGKTNWYRQVWEGHLLVKHKNNSFEILQVGEWHQISKTGQIFSLDNFDGNGELIDEKIFDDLGKIENEVHCIQTVINGNNAKSCDAIRRYFPGLELAANGKIVILTHKNGKRDGEWIFYNKDGSINRVLQYRMGKILTSTNPKNP